MNSLQIKVSTVTLLNSLFDSLSHKWWNINWLMQFCNGKITLAVDEALKASMLISAICNAQLFTDQAMLRWRVKKGSDMWCHLVKQKKSCLSKWILQRIKLKSRVERISTYESMSTAVIRSCYLNITRGQTILSWIKINNADESLFLSHGVLMMQS